MKRTFFLVAVVALLASESYAQRRGGGGSGGAPGGGRGRGLFQRPNQPPSSQGGGGGETDTVTMPAAVRKTAEAEAEGGRLVEAERTTEDGEPAYDVTIKHGFLFERSLTIALDGTLLSRQVFWMSLPPAVKSTIGSFEKFGKIGDMFMCFEEGDVNYAVEIHQTNGSKRFYTVSLDGVHEATQVLMAEIPEAVQKTIRAQAAGASVYNIDRSEVHGAKLFNALMNKDGRHRTVSIDATGAVVGTQVFLQELLPPCQQGLLKNAAGARSFYIERSTEDGQVILDVTTFSHGAKREFVLGKEGNLLSTVVPLAEVPEAVQAAIREKTSGGRIIRVDKPADEPGYEVEVERNGKKHTVAVSADGKLE